MPLRPARADEADLLTELCLRSKAVWGYDRAFMRACRAELTLSPADFANSAIQVAIENNRVVGVAQVVAHGDTADLAKLFVEPTVLRGGVGRQLFRWAAETARGKGAKSMSIEADPDAVAFYRRMGAIDDGMAASGSIPGRMLPRLKLRL